MKINAKEARSKFSSLLNRVEEGDKISIFRRGKEVACLVPSKYENKTLPSLKAFRSSIRLVGEPMSSLIVRMRREERY